jgi:DNA-binding winged helix-turn-helix (wHTH) protein
MPGTRIDRNWEHLMANTYDVREQFILNGRWLFDVESDQLTELENRIAGVPVTVRVLALLARAPQTVLRRRQIFDDGRRSFGFEVCDNSLNQVIHSLRGTFDGLDPGRPYIKTVPRIGYCLLAHVAKATSYERTSPSARMIPAPPADPIFKVDRVLGLAAFDASFDKMAAIVSVST